MAIRTLSAMARPASAAFATDPDRAHGEVVLVTGADLKWSPFAHLTRDARAERTGIAEAIECADHHAAIRMEREAGFVVEAHDTDRGMRAVSMGNTA